MQASHIGGISCMESGRAGDSMRWWWWHPFGSYKIVLSISSSHWRFDLWLLICAPKKKKKKQNEIEACGAITQRHTIWPTCLPLDCIPLLCLASLGHMSSATRLQTSFLVEYRIAPLQTATQETRLQILQETHDFITTFPKKKPRANRQVKYNHTPQRQPTFKRNVL